MSVELRCPDCRAKLRLGEAPDAGTEVECPKCGTVFPAPDPADDEDERAPRKKKPARDEEDGEDDKPKTRAKDEDDDDKPKKKAKKPKAAGDPKGPKRRKAKKKETSKAALIGVIAAGLLMLACVTGVLIWFFGRTSKSVEMMYYLPEDADTVSGLNLGHAQKYPEFYKKLAETFKDAEFKLAGDTLAKALGAADADALIDYVVFGSNAKGHSSVVIRTKTEFDGGSLAKLPGAQAKDMGGKTYYLAEAFKGSGKLRVFAPTNRLVVYCPPSVPDGVFQKMLNGHADSKDRTIGVRAGELGKRTTRGTFWGMTVYEGANKPPPAPTPPTAGAAPTGDDAKVQFARTTAETLASAKGVGFKASIGSREVRFELIVWCSDSDKAGSMATKWKESDLGKGDEGEPPRWWKDQVNGLGSKRIGAQLLANLGFGSSGELFYARTAVETLDLKDAVNNMAGRVAPAPPQQGGNGMPQPNGMPPGGMPRRRAWVRR